MSNLTAKQHVLAAAECHRNAVALKNHIAYLRGDAFGLRLQVEKLEEKVIWHLDYAEAIKKNQQQFMYQLV
jgi:hypothetical protein